MLRWSLFWLIAAVSMVPAASAQAATGSVGDTTAANFAAGDPGSDTYIAETGDGEVLLRPALGAEFYGSSLPPGWSATTQSGGGITVQGGALSADGAQVASNSLFAPPRSLEFRATFATTPAQSMGFADLSVPDRQRWVRFRKLGAGNDLYASSKIGDRAPVDTLIPGSLIGSPHRFRVVWNMASIDFYVDGALVATHAPAPTLSERVLAADDQLDGTGVIVDWLRMTPFAAAGTFDSHVLDASRRVNWGSFSWNGTTPAGTTLALRARTGDTPTPDGSWSAFAPVSVSGASVGQASRFIQYRAELTSSDPGVTPSLDDVTIDYTDTTADPTVTIDTVSDTLLGPADASTGVTWHASEDGSYSVRVGGTDCATGTAVATGSYTGAPATRTTTVNASDLAEGANTIRVCVTNAAANTGSQTTTVVKDTTAPTVTIDTVSDMLLGPADGSTDVTWHASEDGSYSVRVGVGGWAIPGAPCTTGVEAGSGAYSGAPAQRTTSVGASLATDGLNPIWVCVADAAGNRGEVAVWVVKDVTGPTVTIDAVSDASVGSGDPGTDVQWRSSESGSYSVRVGGTNCTTGTIVASGTYTGWETRQSTTVNAAQLAEGTNTIRICVTDAWGNSGTRTTTVVKNTVAPTVTIDGISDSLLGPADSSTDLTWHASQDGNYSVRVGGTSCTTGTVVASGAYTGAPATRTTTVTVAQLAEGSNTIRVCVTDAAGNVGSQITGVVKDTTAPAVLVDSVSDSLLGGGDVSTNVTWHASENGSYSVRVGGADCASGAAVASGSYTGVPATRTTTVTAAQLAEGSNTIRVCVADAAGNEASQTTTVVKDTTAPAVVIDGVSDALIYSTDSSTDVTWHADVDGPFSVRVGGTSCSTGTAVSAGSYTGAPAARTTTVSAAQLAEGNNTIRVCVTDSAGNEGAQTTSVVKDSTRATHTFTPQADSRVEEANPDSNFGTSTTLRVEGGSALDIESYLRFQVSGVGGIEQVKLRLWVTNGTANGPAAYKTDWGGAETAITWNNRPARTSGATDDKGAIPVDAYVDYDLTPLVTGNGTHSFVLAGTSSDGFNFSSRESSIVSQRPQLIVNSAIQSGPDTQPPTAPTGLTASAPSSGLVNLNWNPSIDNVGVTGYRIFRGGNLLTTVGNVTNYTDSTVQPNTTYQYQVRAIDAATPPNVSNPSNTATVTTPAPAPDPIIMAMGDIACDPTSSSFNNGNGTSTSCRQRYTSDLLVNQPGLSAVIVPGDIQYECAGYQAFLQSYDPSWGRVKGITYPAPGNHEYDTTGGLDCDATGSGQGYFTYFGARAGDPTKGYYSFNLGSWHIAALNSNCAIVSCSATSTQANWLRQDLAANPRTCTLAFWHHPRFTSGTNAPGSTSVRPLYQVLYENKADVLLVGHDHDYERFAPKDPDGAVVSNGVREFVVGVGGRSFHPLTALQPGSEAFQNNTFGVLKMTLRPTSYDWQFVPEAGKTYTDSGTTSCTA
jgi:hypothetical protein